MFGLIGIIRIPLLPARSVMPIFQMVPSSYKQVSQFQPWLLCF